MENVVIEGRLIENPIPVGDSPSECLLRLLVNRQDNYSHNEATVHAERMLATSCMHSLNRGDLVRIEGEVSGNAIEAKKILSLTKRGR